jgi:hypothetical protein
MTACERQPLPAAIAAPDNQTSTSLATRSAALAPVMT